MWPNCLTMHNFHIYGSFTVRVGGGRGGGKGGRGGGGGGIKGR